MASRLAAALLQRLDQRQEGFAGAEQLAAFAPQDLGPVRGGSLDRHLDQRRLADPGLAGDERDLAPSGHGLTDQAIECFQLRVASDPVPRAFWGVLGRRGRWGLIRLGGHGAGEAVAPAGDRRDPGRPVRGRPQGSPKGRYLHGQIGVLDDGAGPDFRHDLGFGHKVARPRGQQAQYVKRAGPDGHGREPAIAVTSKQASAPAFEPKRAESENSVQTDSPLARQIRDAGRTTRGATASR